VKLIFKEKRKDDPAGLTLYTEEARFPYDLPRGLANENFQKNT